MAMGPVLFVGLEIANLSERFAPQPVLLETVEPRPSPVGFQAHNLLALSFGNEPMNKGNHKEWFFAVPKSKPLLKATQMLHGSW